MTNIADTAREYQSVAKQIKLLEQQKSILRDNLLNSVGEEKSVIEDGIRVTVVKRAITKFPLADFKDMLQTQGVEAVFSICNVVQTRLSAIDKTKMEVVGYQHPSIRVSGNV